MNQQTSTEQLRQNTAMTEQKVPDNFPAMLKAFQSEIARALPKHLSGDRMARVALTAFRRNPKLQNCDPRSVFASVIQASQLGLEPDTLGRAYLVPYGQECQFIPGWKGLVELVNRTGKASCWTGAVFLGDYFDYGLGDRPFVSHKPMGEYEPDKMTHVYAVGRVNGADWPYIEVWPISRVWKHRDRYNKVGKQHYSYENPEMYARKVVLLQVIKYLPATAELDTAINLSHAAESGQGQGITIEGAIENTFDAGAAPPAPAATQVGDDTGNAPQQTQQPAQQPAATQNQASAATSPGPAANPPQQESQPAPVQNQQLDQSASGMQFADALDYIRTCPDTPQEQQYCQELISRFTANEQQMLKQYFDQRWGQPQQQQAAPGAQQPLME